MEAGPGSVPPPACQRLAKLLRVGWVSVSRERQYQGSGRGRPRIFPWGRRFPRRAEIAKWNGYSKLGISTRVGVPMALARETCGPNWKRYVARTTTGGL